MTFLYGAQSGIHGKGLFTRKALRKGESIGHLSTIFNCYSFKDDGLGGLINQSKKPNVSLYHMIDGQKIKVYGRANQAVHANGELTADYTSPLAPKPNFMAEADAKYCQRITLGSES